MLFRSIFRARYSHGDQVDQPLILQKAGVGFFYYHSNHQGSITHLTNSSGTVANSYIYDSYGRQLNVFESVIQPYSYTGREFDQESGLYYYRARYVDATTGRFLSEDPIGFTAGDQNLYRYVFNNPVNLKDPFGLQGAATNPGGAVGDLPGAINDILGGQSDTRATQDLFEALQDFSSTLEPGQQADVDVFVDPVTKQILDVRPSGETSIRNPGTRRFGPFRQEGFLKLPPPGFNPNRSPLCNTCPCK